MELWMIYAISASVTIGIFWFCQKIEAESSLNHNTFLIYIYLGYLLYPIAVHLLWIEKIYFDVQAMVYAFLVAALYITILRCRLKSLCYLTSSTYFINYRIFSSIFLIISGQLFFGEFISVREYMWVLLGFLIFFLLIEKKQQQETKQDMYKGYVYLWISAVLITLLWVIQKNFILHNASSISYIFYGWFFGILLLLLTKHKTETVKSIFYITNKRHILFLIFASIVFTLWIILNLLALRHGWDVAIVYKIISYSLFVPIIGSIIFYKETVTFKKIIAFILTIASIGLFI